MIEAEPAFLHLWRQLRQRFIQRRPWSKMLQSSGATFFKALFQMEPTFVVHVMVELGIHIGGGVSDKAPTRLAQCITVCFRVDKHRADAQARFQHHLGGIATDVGLLGHLGFGHAVIAVAQHLKDAELLHQATHLEHNRSPGNPFGLGLRLTCRKMFLTISFF